MLKTAITIICVGLLPVFSVAGASEIQEWAKAVGYAIVCHEAGHSVAGETKGVPVEFKFDAGGPHYFVNYPAYQQDSQLLLQLQTGNKVVKEWNETIKNGSPPSTTYENVQAAHRSAIDAHTKLINNFQAWENNTNRTLAYVAGGGFEGQQYCESKLKGQMKSKYLVVSGSLYKISYSIFTKSLQPGTYDRGGGDVEAFKLVGGFDLARIALAVSGFTDIYRGVYDPDSSWSVGFFRGIKGQPGLQFNYVF